MRTRRYIGPLSVVALFLVALCVALLLGPSRRIELPQQQVISSASARETYDAIRQSGVRGRTLILLDNREHMTENMYLASFIRQLDDPALNVPVTQANKVTALAVSGAIRQVVLVVPSSEWPEMESWAKNSSQVVKTADGFRSRRLVIAIDHTSSERFVPPAEKAVVLVNGTLADQYDSAFLQSVTAPDRADLVVIEEVSKR